jgi:hypothetical protein
VPWLSCLRLASGQPLLTSCWCLPLCCASSVAFWSAQLSFVACYQPWCVDSRLLTVLAALAHLWPRPSVECGSPHLQSRLLLPTVALSYLRCLRCSPQSSAQCKIPSIRRLPAECRSHPCPFRCWVATPPGIWFGGFSPLRSSLQLLAFPLAVGSSDGLITYRRRYLHHCLSYPVAGLGCHRVISTLPLGVWEQQQQQQH